MSTERVNHVEEYDSDIIGDQIGKSVRSLYFGSTLLDETSWYIALATFFGGSQLGVEATKIVKGTAGDKFPLGWESLNVAEELLEGSIPAVIGAFIGKRVFRLICDTFSDYLIYNKHGEVMFMFAGAAAGYGVMMQSGFWIEERLGIYDIKWGSFK